MEPEARFERIEKNLEAIGNSVTALAAAQLRSEYAISDAVEQMARSHKQLLTAQVLMADAQAKTDEAMTKLAAAQAKSDLANAAHAGEIDDTKEKLHLLFNIVDSWIRERRREGRNGEATGNAPKA